MQACIRLFAYKHLHFPIRGNYNFNLFRISSSSGTALPD